MLAACVRPRHSPAKTVQAEEDPQNRINSLNDDRSSAGVTVITSTHTKENSLNGCCLLTEVFRESQCLKILKELF